MMRFAKQPWTVSVKQCAWNFETILREVNLGRVVNIWSRHKPVATLVPIYPKNRVALARQPRGKMHAVPL